MPHNPRQKEDQVTETLVLRVKGIKRQIRLSSVV
jgi:hypothetical protein